MLMETPKTAPRVSEIYVISGVDIDVSRGDLDLEQFPNGLQLGE